MKRSTASVWGMICVSLLATGPARAGEFELLSPAAIESDTAGGVNHDTLVQSADGRWVAFSSYAENLVTGQQESTPSRLDVFLHDRDTGTTVLVSHGFGSSTQTGSHDSFPASISADGRWLAFESLANNLVPGQNPNTVSQVFLHDRDTGTNTLVSHSTAGPQAESAGSAFEATVSADGDWVAFAGAGADLVAGLTGPSAYNVFLYERATGEIRLVSRAAGTTITRGNQASYRPSVSADGRYVAFKSRATNLVAGYTGSASFNAFLFDRVTGSMVLASRSVSSGAHGVTGENPVISADGSTVAFLSRGDDLVAGQVDGNLGYDAFLYDRASDTCVLASRSAASPVTAGNRSLDPELPLRISATGAYVAFASEAFDAVAGQVDGFFSDDLFLFERATSSLVLVSRSSASPVTAADQPTGGVFGLSADGRFVAFHSQATDLVAGQVDTGQTDLDVFLFDRTTGTNTLVSGAGGSAQVTGLSHSRSPTISADGAVVAFVSGASNLAPGIDDFAGSDVLLFDRVAGSASVASRTAPGMASATAGSDSLLKSASADARYAVLLSAAGNLVAGQADDNLRSDVFLVDRLGGTTTLVSRSASSPTTASNGGSSGAAISADGGWIVFDSTATDLVSGQVDTPATPDFFLYERATGTVTLLSHAAGSPLTAGDYACGYGESFGITVPLEAAISQDGRWIAFECMAGNLVAGQAESAPETTDIFLHDRVTGQTALVSRGHASATTAGDHSSGKPRISADGRWIAFESQAINLVAGATDGNGASDVFLHDRDTGQTQLASRAAGTAATAASGGSSSPALSADGRNVVFTSTAWDLVPGQTDPLRNLGDHDIFLFDRATGTVELISRAAGSATATGNGFSKHGAVDADGRHVAFYSEATNLVPGQTGPKKGVFLHDRVTRTTELLSHTGASRTETQGIFAVPVLSSDGRFVAFVGDPPLYLADRQLGTLERVAVAYVFSPAGTSAGPVSLPALSSDGSAVLFTSYDRSLAANDFNRAFDVFAYVRSAPQGSDFFTVSPCRVETGTTVASGSTLLLQVHGACGVPESATAVAVNVTVTQPTGTGRLTLHPGNLAAPLTSTLNFAAGRTLANNAILPLALNGEGTLAVTAFVNGNGTVRAILDVSGYFE